MQIMKSIFTRFQHLPKSAYLTRNLKDSSYCCLFSRTSITYLALQTRILIILKCQIPLIHIHTYKHEDDQSMQCGADDDKLWIRIINMHNCDCYRERGSTVFGSKWVEIYWYLINLEKQYWQNGVVYWLTVHYYLRYALIDLIAVQ